MRIGSIHLKRETLVVALGGRCSCLGDNCYHTGNCAVMDRRCLQIDHIDGRGAEDRKRLQNINLVNYYFNHLDEAREKLQLLCANCNWVKRNRNSEVRNGDKVRAKEKSNQTPDPRLVLRTRVMNSLTGIPGYADLEQQITQLSRQALESSQFDVLHWIESLEFVTNGRSPLSYYLVKRWEKQKIYKDDQPGLNGFIKECQLDIDSIQFMLDARLGRRNSTGK